MDATDITPSLLRSWPLPMPQPDGDKEVRGHLLIVAGSTEMPGAIVLAATAALRAGAGKLTIAAPESVALGLALASLPVAHAALDISDGLVGDLGHILQASRVGATLDVDALPAGPVLAQQAPALRRRFTAAGGDDYELCFTAPRAARDAVLAAGMQADTLVTRVGTIDAAPGLRLVDTNGAPLTLGVTGWDHFTSG